jgi:hypothetical protein
MNIKTKIMNHKYQILMKYKIEIMNVQIIITLKIT